MNYELEKVSPLTNTSTRIYHLYLSQTHYMKRHYHPYLEIVYVLKGNFYTFIDDQKTYRKLGDIFLIQPSFIHCFEMCEDSEMITLLISQQSLKNYDYDLDGKEFFIDEKQSYEELKEMMLQVDKVRKSEDIYRQLLIEKYLSEIYYFILTNMTRKSNCLTISYPLQFQPVIEYIENHYQEHISYQDLSQKFGYSYAYFCRQFKKMTGTTLLQFQKSIQLKHAYLDVCYSSLQMNQIAYQHGFLNTKLFIEAFKKEYHMTPYQYRIKSQK